MLNFVLKRAVVPVLMLAAMPAQAAVTLDSAGLATATAGDPFRLTDADRFAWYEKRAESDSQFFFLFDLGSLPGLRATTPVATATILPEPMSWAMTFAGMAIIGWVVRSRQRRRSQLVSFV